MRLHAKIFALLFSAVCLLTPAISHAEVDPGKLSTVDWANLGASGTITKDHPLVKTLWLSFAAAATMDVNERPDINTLNQYSQAEKDSLMAQFMAANEQHYNEYMGQLAGYVHLLDQIQANPEGTDYGAIAQQLGLPTDATYTPKDITDRLNQIKNIYDSMLAGQQAAAASGISTGEYMLYLLGVVGVNNAYCGGLMVNPIDANNPTTPEQFYGPNNANCWNDIKNQVNTIISAPPAELTEEEKQQLEEQRRLEEQEQQRLAEEERQRQAAEEQKRQAEEQKRLAEEEQQRQLAEQQRLAEENAKLLQQYNDFLDELQKYQDLWNEVTDKINNQQDIDWDDIARRMGIEPSTPDDIYKRLGDLKSYHEVWDDFERARAASGQTPEDFMRWILGQTSDANGKTCADARYNNCYSQTRNKLDDILHQPSVKPPNTQPHKTTDFFDIGYMVDSFHTQIPAFIHLLYALSYTIGFLFIIIALFRLKEYGTNPMYRQSGLITSCLSYFVAGVMLIYLPSALDVGAATFLADNGDNSLFSYTAVKNKGFGYEELVSPVVDIVKIVGLLAFIRGWVMLSKMGNEQHKGVMFKGLMHVIGGILAVNILGVYTIFARIFVRVFSG